MIKRIQRPQLKWLIDNLDVIEAYGEIYLAQSKAYTKQVDVLAKELRQGKRNLRTTNKFYSRINQARKTHLDKAREIILITRQIDAIFTRIPKSYKEAIFVLIQTGSIRKAQKEAQKIYEYKTQKEIWRQYYTFLTNITATTLINNEKVIEIKKTIHSLKATKITPY